MLKSSSPRLIFLIGFMGSGKTTVGKELAALLNITFIDLDNEIVKLEKKSISELFKDEGEDYFRIAESRVLKSFDLSHNAVIATGGGTPCFYDNMKWMNEHGITVYFKVLPEILFRRLKPEIQLRPLLHGKSENELLEFIHSTLAEREKFYIQSTHILYINDHSSMKLTQQLSTLLN